jgi:hypothetical protein
MEPATREQRRSGNSFATICPRLLIAWLKSPCGQPLREAIERELLPNLAERLFDGSEESKRLQEEVIDRADATVRAVVTVQPTEMGDVDVIAYGPKELRVRIVRLPMVPPEPELQGLVEKLIQLELPKNYRRLWNDLSMKDRAILGRKWFHFWEWIAMEKEKNARIAFSQAIKGATK